MSEAAISTLKNHLPEWVHKAEQGEDIQITRHGKPVAVMVSLEKYQRAFPAKADLANVFKRWREQYPEAEGFTAEEEKAMYERTREPLVPRPGVWEEID
ncbi:MAG: type II toxin-antitoxin system Phd/YefM family antitoxin [Thiolinea sp.]